MNKNIKGITVNISTKNCSKCEKMNVGTILYERFRNFNSFMQLNRDGDIEINSDELMRLIMIVNECQMPKKIKLVSQDEFFDDKR